MRAIEHWQLTLNHVPAQNMLMRVVTHFILFIAALFFTTEVSAKTRLMTLSDGVIVYSGPGAFYRPLTVLPAKTEVRSSSATFPSRDGAYYRVLVKLGETKSVIGYVSARADVRRIDDTLGEDELEKFGDVALVSRAVQLSYSVLRDRNSIVTLGYMKYLSPGFYVKGFAGQFSGPQTTATVGGGEIGNDALLIGRFSGLVSYAAGIFAPSSTGTVFEASSSVNGLMQAAFGVRYNLRGIASVSAAVTQAVFFNANNSLVTSGGNVTLEVGL